MLLFSIFVPVIRIFYSIIPFFYSIIIFLYSIVDFFNYIYSIVFIYLLTSQGYLLLLVFGFLTQDDIFTYYFKCLFLLYFVNCLYNYVLVNTKIFYNYPNIRIFLLFILNIVQVLLLGIIINIITNTLISYLKTVLSYILKMNNSASPENNNHPNHNNDNFNNNDFNNGRGPDNHSHIAMNDDSSDSDSDSDSDCKRVEHSRRIFSTKEPTPTQRGAGFETIYDNQNRRISKIYFHDQLINGVSRKDI